MKTILVCGGRDFGKSVLKNHPDYDKHQKEFKFIFEELDNILSSQFESYFIISGGATGADTAAISYAITRDYQFHEYEADWGKHGKAAGSIRNQQMLDEGKPDLVIAFPGGNGTKDMIKKSKAANVFVREIKYDC